MPPSNPSSGRLTKAQTRAGLVVWRTPHLRKLVDEILVNSGFNANTFVNDHETATLQLRYGGSFSFVLCEATDQHSDHFKLAEFIRWNHLCHTPQLPLVVYGENWTVQSFHKCRNAGVSGVIAFPSTIQGFLRRFIQAVCNPPPFVICDTFRGPDRRAAAVGGEKCPKRRKTDQMPSAPLGAMGQADLLRTIKKRED